MLKKSFSAAISVILALAICVCTCSSAFAASSGSKKYIKEVILSYGDTVEDAITWLSNNGYEVVDNNLNEGADALLSTKRAVCLGYKTTSKASEAITDMKLMNMNGGYSIQDYQMLLSQQADNIKAFFENFKVAVQEYRNNYNAGQARAVAAHDLLNMLYDDDTKQSLGDLLLNRVREEYTDEEYNALSAEEQAKVADMTTILMQGNANAVLAMEQIIATAADESDTPWLNRYKEAKTYDEMLDELMESENLTVNQAEKELASRYDADSKKIVANFENYKSYISKHTVDEISLESTAAELEAYQKAHDDFNYAEWCAAATQCEVLKSLTNDDVSLYDLIFGTDYDVFTEDRYMLYPLVSVLSSGQRACLDFLSLYQLIALGINDDSTTKAAMEQVNIASNENLTNISVYDGVDRTVFGEDVALTGDAYKLQASSGKNPTEEWYSSISTTSVVLVGATVVASIVTAYTWVRSSHLEAIVKNFSDKADRLLDTANDFRTQVNDITNKLIEGKKSLEAEQLDQLTAELSEAKKKFNSAKEEWSFATDASESAGTWSRFMNVAKVAMTCVTAVLLGFALWSTISEIKEYYNAKLTPIPSNMVNQSVDENDEKVFTYYKAVKCNRNEQNMVTDNTKLLGDLGDLNGDVGRQWLALYTTKDKSAGDPITADFAVQYSNTNIPSKKTALSIFCESVAQNLTDKKAGYTYSDGKNGIYLFYGTDANAFAGSVISDGTYYVLVGGASAIVAAAIAFFAGKAVGKKGKKEEKPANA